MRRYVVDSADPDSIAVSKTELHELLAKPALEGIPVLVLGNKNARVLSSNHRPLPPRSSPTRTDPPPVRENWACELNGACTPTFAAAQDLPEAVSVDGLIERLELKSVSNREVRLR